MPPAWLISLIITILQKTGAINWAEKLAIKAGAEVVEDLGNLQTYSAPTDFPSPPSDSTTTSNINKG